MLGCFVRVIAKGRPYYQQTFFLRTFAVRPSWGSSRRPGRSASLSSFSEESRSSCRRLDEATTTGSLVARVFPRHCIDFQNRKPNDVVCNALELRNRLQTPIPECTHWTGDPEPPLEGWVVALDLDLCRQEQQADSAREEANRMQMHLHRTAQESAIRTLKRLEISIGRKIRQQIKLQHGKSRDAWHAMRIQERPRADSDASATSTSGGPASATVWVDSSTMNGQEAQDDEDESESLIDGYRSLRIPEDISSQAFWKELSCYQEKPMLTMDVLEGENHKSLTVNIEACPPTILAVKSFEEFHSHLFVGTPVVVEVDSLHAARVVVTWFVEQVEVRSDSSWYTPSQEDVGKKISVLLVPIRPGHSGQGYEEAYEFAHPVEERPDLPILEPLRNEWTAPRNSQEDLRVVSYNLLADLYTSREEDQLVMYNHCKPKFLSRDRRMPLLVYEILAYHADLICLQEVDATIFDSLLRPVLESQGYQGYYSNKASAQLEGCALFWSLQSFERIDEDDMHEYSLRDSFCCKSSRPLTQMDQESCARWKSMEDIDHLLAQHPELRRVAREKVGQVVQIASLKVKPSSRNKPDKLVVANTHLFYHPMADHVRAMQAYAVCRQMDIIRCAAGDGLGPLPPIILCGDLNSGPLSGAVHLLLQRRLEPDHFETWRHLNKYQWEMGDHEFLLEHGYVGNEVDSDHDPAYQDECFQDAQESLSDNDSDDDNKRSNEDEVDPPPHIRLPLSFPKLLSGYPEIPVFTNYAVDFSETLDYVLASEPSNRDEFGFSAKRAAPVPPVRDMEETYIAMPNEFMPSDHVSLVCDLEWRRHD